MVFGFGKRTSSSSSGGSRGSGDATYQRQPPHIRRLIDAMQTIFDDASALAEAIRHGGSLPTSTPTEPHLSPIRCSASETLFEHPSEAGEKQYTTYHFTKDFKTVNAAAQYNLYVMYSRIYVANILAGKLSNGNPSEAEAAELKNAIDEALAKSAYYINYFRSYSLSADILMNRIGDENLQKALDDHGADWMSNMDAAKRAMFQPERLLELVPDRQPVFVFAVSEPYQDGQTVINGVHFKREHAQPLLKDAAEQQARAISARGR